MDAIGLILVLAGIPLIGSAVLAVVPRLLPRTETGHFLTISVVILVALCASGAALFSHGASQSQGVSWIPGTGMMTVGTGTVALVMIAVTAWSALPALIAMPQQTAVGALMLAALATANAATLSNNFLARYVVLEILALVVALTPLVELGTTRGATMAVPVYLLLRLGDAGLLAGLVILNIFDGGLALRVVETLPATIRVWIVAGFLLAAWVKLGAWPFHVWLRGGASLSPVAHAWLYATVVPNLGAFLLYRITSVLSSSATLCLAILWLGGVSMPIALIARRQKRHSAAVGLVAAQGGLTVVLAATGARALVWQNALLSIVPRLLLFHAADARRSAHTKRLMNSLGWLSAAGLSMLMTWKARHSIAQSGLPPIHHVPFLFALASTILMSLQSTQRQTGETQQDDLNQHEMTPAVQHAGEMIYRLVRQQGPSGMQQWAARSLLTPVRCLQRLHTGRLRRNLLWIAGSLALALLGALLAPM